MGRKTVIADYYLLFKKRSEFIFRCFKKMNCFIIKKYGMFDILEKTKKYGDIIKEMKVTTFERYKTIIREPMMDHKKGTHKTFTKRCDYEQNLVLQVDQNDDEVEEDILGEETSGEKCMKKLKKVEKSIGKL
jgi:hypothetical protein